MSEKDKPSGLEDIKISYAPENLTEDEIEYLLRQDVRIDFHKIARSLEDFHGLFSQMWDMGYPSLTWQIPTAAVCFNKDYNRVDFLFNPIAWQKLDLYTKAFIVGHECLHAILNHGMRAKDCPLPQLANIAMDIVVNHMLVSKFGFSRACIDLSPLIEGQKDEQGNAIKSCNERNEDIFLCWIDTVFGSKSGEIKRNKPFEYYYALLEEHIVFSKDGKGNIKLKIKGTGSGKGDEESSGGNVLDEHDHLEDFDDEDVKEDISNKLNEKLTEEEKKDFSDKVMKSEDGKSSQEKDKKRSKGEKGGKQAGSIGGKLVYRPDARNVIRKRKWETIIRKWAHRYTSEEATAEQWARKNRRMISFEGNLITPHEMTSEDRDLQKIEVFFFLDFSGSCFHLKDRFFKAVSSLPKDRFNVNLFCFDTEVYKVDIQKPELRGGGGTSFSILENKVQNMVKMGEIAKYPDAVWVMTDGYGDHVNPERPKNWYWFLSCNYKDCIPKECQIFNLEDFE